MTKLTKTMVQEAVQEVKRVVFDGFKSGLGYRIYLDQDSCDSWLSALDCLERQLSTKTNGDYFKGHHGPEKD